VKNDEEKGWVSKTMQPFPCPSAQETHGKIIRCEEKRESQKKTDHSGHNAFFPKKHSGFKKRLPDSPKIRINEVPHAMHECKTPHQDTELPPETHQEKKEPHTEKSGQRTQEEDAYQEIPGCFPEIPPEKSQYRDKESEKRKECTRKQKTLYERMES